MPRTSPAPKVETLTFRLEPALKAAFARIADEEHKPSANCCASWFANGSSAGVAGRSVGGASAIAGGNQRGSPARQ